MMIIGKKESTVGLDGQSLTEQEKSELKAEKLIRGVVCDKCKSEIILRAVDVEADIRYVGDIRLWLVWFACPNCHAVYKINLEDDVSKDLLNEVLELRTRIKNAVDRGHTPKQSLYKTLKRKEQVYKKTHMKVAKEYNYLFTELEKSEGEKQNG